MSDNLKRHIATKLALTQLLRCRRARSITVLGEVQASAVSNLATFRV
jgi:hypothetical protein